MIAAAEFGADGGRRHLTHIDGEVDGNMSGEGDVGVAAGTYELLVRYVVILLDYRLHGVDVDLLMGGVEVLIGDAVDVLTGKLATFLFFVPSISGATLAEAFELADVGAGDLSHMAQMLIAESAHTGTERAEK